MCQNLDTNKHKVLEKDILMYCHQAAKILQFSILHYYNMFSNDKDTDSKLNEHRHLNDQILSLGIPTYTLQVKHRGLHWNMVTTL